MKKLLLSTALLALTTGASLAADLPSRKEPLLPPPPPPPMWTGIYAGLNAGYGFGTNSNTQSIGAGALADIVGVPGFEIPGTAGLALSGTGSQNQSGFIGGGQIGYNYQWGQNIVIGIEADMQGTGIRGTSRGAGIGQSSAAIFAGPADTLSATGVTAVQGGIDWMGTVRGRLGYLWTPTMLVYATGGLTYGGAYANVVNNATETLNVGPIFGSKSYTGGGTRSSTLVGWNVGGGLEWMFMPNWSLKAEGIYWNMGNMNVATASYGNAISNVIPGGGWGANPSVVAGATRVNYQGVIARMGVNYHFNFGGSAPIVAKY
jgi:outer membrane immunogenic protein